MKNEDREIVIAEITSRIVESRMTKTVRGDYHSVLREINDTVYYERKRLKDTPTSNLKTQDMTFWKSIQSRFPRADEKEQKEILNEITERFVREVAGNFSPMVYQFSSKILPMGLSFLLNSLSPQRLIKNITGKPTLEESIRLGGKTKHFQALADKGTMVLVPTHTSNLDSPVIGWSIFELGLPPFTYGAGLNLFANPFLSFFMQNLGAYRVDRTKKAKLYKDVLKEYASCSMEYNYHNLFFPGGTRIRSGCPERGLKKGLLGTALSAYINKLKKRQAKPDVFIIPCTINYHLVLEAETLIEDYLKEAGKSRYIIENDESSDFKKIVRFVSSLSSMNANIELHFGDPMDPFGNLVDEEGRSMDKRGRIIDRERYVYVNDEPEHDAQRDREYTQECAQSVEEQFSKYNMIMVTHLVAKACFTLFQKKNSNLDLYQLLHTGGYVDQFPIPEVIRELDHLVEQVKELTYQGKLLLEPWLKHKSSEQILSRSLQLFASYHSNPAIERRGDRVAVGDGKLLYYYQNRLDGYELQSFQPLEFSFSG